MVNPLKGEVELVTGGKTYVLRLGTNALVEIETVLGGMDFGEIVRSLAGGNNKATVLRAVLWGSMRRYQPDVTLFDVGDLIDEFPEAVGKASGEVMRLGMPDQPKGGAQNPRKAAAGTGTRSSKAGSHSASQRKPSGR